MEGEKSLTGEENTISRENKDKKQEWVEWKAQDDLKRRLQLLEMGEDTERPSNYTKLRLNRENPGHQIKEK